MMPLPRQRARSLACLLVVVLLLAQLLGLMHGVVHGPQAHALASAQEHTHRHVHDGDFAGGHEAHDSDPDHGGGWVEALFSSHEADSDCRLFDQASHGSAVPVLAAVSLPVVLSSFVVDLPQGEALARWAALFDARGPPLTF